MTAQEAKEKANKAREVMIKDYINLYTNSINDKIRFAVEKGLNDASFTIACPKQVCQPVLKYLAIELKNKGFTVYYTNEYDEYEGKSTTLIISW